MPIDRKPDAAPALTSAERQANYRARRQALQAIPAIPLPSASRSPQQTATMARRRRRVARPARGIRRLVRHPTRQPQRNSHGRGAPRTSSNSTSVTWPPSNHPAATDATNSETKWGVFNAHIRPKFNGR